MEFDPNLVHKAVCDIIVDIAINNLNTDWEALKHAADEFLQAVRAFEDADDEADIELDNIKSLLSFNLKLSQMS